MTSSIFELDFEPDLGLEEDENDNRTVHVIETCLFCFYHTESWYIKGKKYLTLCGKYESNSENILDIDKNVDCIDCIMAIPTNICAVCGKKVGLNHE